MGRVYKVLPICLIVLGLVCPGCRPSSTAKLEENKNRIRHWVEHGFNKGNLDMADEFYATDYIFHSPFPPYEDVKGVADIKQLMATFQAAIPDANYTIEDAIAEDDKVVVRLTFTGTHKGELMGIAPTGNQIKVNGICIIRMADGKFVEEWYNLDTLGFMQQLGAIPAVGEQKERPAVADAEPEKLSGFVIVDGIKLPYFIEGTGIPCMVVLDGLVPSRALSKKLREHFRFIFLYSRMLVPFDKPVEIDKITMDTYVDDVEQVRKALGLEKVAVFGHSISGLLALEYARKYPEHATHVIMHGTPPYYNTKSKEIVAENWEVHASDERKRILKQNWERLPADTLSKLSPSDAGILRYITDGPKIWYNPTYDASWLLKGTYWNMEVWNHLFEVIMAKYDLTKEDKIKTPVFLALGRYDFLVPYYLWDDKKDKLPNLSYNLFEKSGHYPMLEEQALFDKKLIAWIKGQK